MLSGWNLFGVLKLSFIAVRPSNVLFWNKAEAELVFKNEAEAWEKTPAIAALLLNLQELAALLWLRSIWCLAQPSKQSSLTKTEAMVPKWMDFGDLRRIPVGLWLYRSDDLQFYHFICLVRWACSCTLIPGILEIIGKSWVWSSFASLMLLGVHLRPLKIFSLSVMIRLLLWQN